MKAALLLLALVIGSCSDDRPPAPTAEESDQLNEAEHMLNAETEEAEGS
jgi:hypothetical protein